MAARTELRVVVEPSEPFLYVNENGGKLKVSGPMRIMLDAMASYVNFNYTFHRSIDSQWGLAAGENYTGMAGMLQRNETDIALVPFIVNFERNKVIHFTHPFYIDTVSIISRSSSNKMFNFRLRNIFTLEVWIAILLTIVIVSLVSSFINRVLKVQRSHCLHFEDYLSTLLGKGVNRIPDNDHLRLLFGIWLIFCTLVYNCILTQILSSLVAEEVDNVDNFQNLVAHREMVPVLENGSHIEHQIKTSTNKNAQEIWTRVKRSNTSLLNSGQLRSTDFTDRVQRGEAAAIVESYAALGMISKRVQLGNKCSFHVSKDNLGTIVLSMAVRKDLNPHLITAIDNWTSRIMPSGLCDHWLNEHGWKAVRCLLSNYGLVAKVSPIRLKSLKTPFLLWAGGLLLADIVLIGEYLVNQRTSSETKKSELIEFTEC